VRDLVALAYEGFADCKRTDGHDRLLAGESGNLSAGVRQGVKPARIPDTGQAHVRHLDSSQKRSPGPLGKCGTTAVVETRTMTARCPGAQVEHETLARLAGAAAQGAPAAGVGYRRRCPDRPKRGVPRSQARTLDTRPRGRPRRRLLGGTR